jgi:hypothetical protein
MDNPNPLSAKNHAVTITPEWKTLLQSMQRGELKPLIMPERGINHIVIRIDDFDEICRLAGIETNFSREPNKIVWTEADDAVGERLIS